MSSPSNHLCVCLTPLHVLIAARIAEARGVKFSSGLYVTNSDNEKQRHYANQMRDFCLLVEYLVLPSEDSYGKPKHLSIYARRLRYRFAFRKYGPVTAIYVPTNISGYVYLLLSAVNVSTLVTFDDGQINIQANSPLLRQTSLLTKLFLLAAGVTYWPERIRARTSIHYTIYEMDNLYSPVVHVNLLDSALHASDYNHSVRSIKIFIGVAPEADPEIWRLVKDAVHTIKPDAYLPHPREINRRFEGIPYLETPLVAEDYFLRQLKSNPNAEFQIYGLDSSALINLASTPGIKAFSVLNDTPQNSATRMLMKRCGVFLAS